jgi:hypothetical protein
VLARITNNFVEDVLTRYNMIVDTRGGSVLIEPRVFGVAPAAGEVAIESPQEHAGGSRVYAFSL